MFKRNFAVILIAALVFGVGAHAWAQEGPVNPELDDTPAVDRPAGDDVRPYHRRHRPRRLAALRRAYHGELQLWVDGETRDVRFDRGALVSADDDSVTVEYPSGDTADFAVTDATRVRGAGDDGELVVGEPTLVLSEGGDTKAVLQRKYHGPPGDLPPGPGGQ